MNCSHVFRPWFQSRGPVEFASRTLSVVGFQATLAVGEGLENIMVLSVKTYLILRMETAPQRVHTMYCGLWDVSTSL